MPAPRPKKPSAKNSSLSASATPPTEHGERLQKLLASAGIGSRRACEAWIEQGRVRVNGQVVTELGTKVLPDKDKVMFDGRPVRLPSRRYYIAVNKPTGVVCSLSDVHAARLVTDLVELPSKPMLRPVGRLDADTEGLIFLSDDGDFLYHLTHPKHHVPKTYRAVVRGVPDGAALQRLTRGIWLEDGPTAPATNVRVKRVVRDRPVIRPPAGNRVDRNLPPPETSNGEGTAEIELTIFEGRKRQVRRMFAAIGHPVIRLARISIGEVRLTGLPVGAWRHLTPKEVAALTREATPTHEENIPSWPEPPPSKPPKAPLSPASMKTTRPLRLPTLLNLPKRDSTTD